MTTILPFPGAGEYGDPYDYLPISDRLFDADLGYPTTSDPDQILLDDGTVVCSLWCTIGDGHPEAIEETERVCRSVPERFVPAAGGGRGAHHRPAGSRNDTAPECPQVPWADASVTIQAEQAPGEPPAIVLATEVAGVEQYITLSIEETDKLAADLLVLGMLIEGVRD